MRLAKLTSQREELNKKMSDKSNASNQSKISSTQTQFISQNNTQRLTQSSSVATNNMCYLCFALFNDLSKYTWNKCEVCDNWVCETCFSSKVPNIRFICSECD